MQPVQIIPEQNISQIVSVSPPHHQNMGQEFNYPPQQGMQTMGGNMGGQMPPQVLS